MTRKKRAPKPKVQIEEEPDGRTRFRYDVSNVPDLDLEAEYSFLLDLPKAGDDEEFSPGSFGERFTAKRRDLLRILAEGVLAVDYLPASDGMLVRGRRHHLVAPNKTGKSIAMQVHACDMIEAGSSGVAIIDRENGKEEYARRLGSIAKAKAYNADDFARINERLHYFEFPSLRVDDGEDLADAMEVIGVDLVVFDSQRMFLTDLGLKEDLADDYALFMGKVIDPLFQRGIATLILDNTGHSNPTRGRGTITKGDLNEVLLVLEHVSDFNRAVKGSVGLKVDRSRFGSRGEWTMELGAGTFGSWNSEEAPSRPELRQAILKILRDGKPRGQDRIFNELRESAGHTVGSKIGRTLLRTLLAEGVIGHELPGGYFMREGS